MTAENDAEGVDRVELAMTYPTEFSGPRVQILGRDHSGERLIYEVKPGSLKMAFNRDEEERLEPAFVLIVQFDVKPSNQPCHVKSVDARYYNTGGEVVRPVADLSSFMENQKRATAPVGDKGRSRSPVPPYKGEDAVISGRPSTPPAASDERKPDETGGNGESAVIEPEEVEKPSFVAYIDPLEYHACPDPLQRFLKHREGGKETGLLSLFASGRPCGFRQTPPVAISDGLGKVSLSFEGDAAPEKVPSIAVTGARFISLVKESGNIWRVELIPNRGEHEVVLYVVRGKVLKRIPLTVAPPLELYLRGISPGERGSPLFDYVVMANHAAMSGETGQEARQ
jgi:hypothetical protein